MIEVQFKSNVNVTYSKNPIGGRTPTSLFAGLTERALYVYQFERFDKNEGVKNTEPRQNTKLIPPTLERTELLGAKAAVVAARVEIIASFMVIGYLSI